MADIAYSISCSLDGYINDAQGNIDFTVPTEEQHSYFNEREAAVGTYLFGRRMYETMRVWDSGEEWDSPAMQEYQEIWSGIDKVVYSTTLDAVSEPRTRLERSFDPDAVRALKESSPKIIGVGGAGMAATLLQAGLLDVISLVVCPVILGGGTPALPAGMNRALTLAEERRLDNIVALSYRVA